MWIRTILRSRARLSQKSPWTRLQSTSTSTVTNPAKSWQPLNLPNISIFQQPSYNATEIAMQKRKKILHDRALKNQKVVNPAVHLREGTNEEVLQLEVEDLLRVASRSASEDASKDNSEVAESGDLVKSSTKQPPIELGTELELDIVELSSTGDGMAYTSSKDHIVVVPFSVPGDKVLAKVYRWLGSYSHADFVKVVEPSASRDGVSPKCQYFADCGGCQLQMLPYQEQLDHKKKIVEKAFKHFSGLTPDQVPAVGDTMGSPLQYGYRTKLTPHFDGPGRRKRHDVTYTSVPNVGYNRKGKRQVIDIEHCPIGTEILQEGLKLEREKVVENYKNYRTGKTILLRESTRREPDHGDKGQDEGAPIAEFDTVSQPTATSLQYLNSGEPELTLTFPTHKDHKTYTSVGPSLSTEYIGPHKFVNRAGSFFQNNNSVLGPFTQYVYQNCMPPTTSPGTSTTKATPTPEIKYLLDAYCGSGLFTVTLSKLFVSALGIDIDPQGIEAARQNAQINNIPNAGFIEADASHLFVDVPFPPQQSLVIIDPPRKGASEDFLKQLCEFGASRVIYVSCNVHTQARDVGMIVQGFGKGQGCRYEIESLRGFDFFPQTGHVEGVCVLNKVKNN